MYHTAEIRWILPGPVPEAVDRWFQGKSDDHGHGGVEPEMRTDRYVVVPGCESVGIKLRDTDGDGPARVDVKARLGDPVELRLTPEVVGLAAAWSKWTLTLADHTAIVSGLEPPTPVVSVHKTRLMRRYVVEGERTREVPIDEDVDDGCDIELSSIVIEDDDDGWWSLGLEAFGPAERVRDTLSSIGRGSLELRGAPPQELQRRLDVRSSKAYPGWLLERLGESGRGG